MSQTITIELNGERRAVPAGETIAGLVRTLGFEPGQVAVERNRALVPRARHGETLLEDGDALEVVTLVGGG